MLDWLISSLRPADVQGYRGDIDESYLEEPPDTPAPLFAVRAFKSALFGTPHPDLKSTNNSPTASDNQPRKQGSDPQPENINIGKPVHTAREGSAINPKADFLASPTKGILLTPGTATTRRKNVSFGGLAFKEIKEGEKSNETDLDVKTKSGTQSNSSIMDFPLVNNHRQTNLTKALYKARIDGSKTYLDKHLIKDKQDKKDNTLQEGGYDLKIRPGIDNPVFESAADFTIDLNEPFSRSGKHWKAEFERYHKKSDREMKKIIKYGQNVKSYAVKKDSEVSDLGEKLQRELSKVATMEANVTNLAAQLANTRSENPRETSEQSRLMNDLAKQTALAVRYKQKADRYKVALMKQSSATQDLETTMVGDIAAPDSLGIPSQAVTEFQESRGLTPELESLRAELETFRNSAQRAERKAARLETENLALKKTIVRLREDIRSGETERLARKESFKKRIEKFQASRADFDIQSTSEYQNLAQGVDHEYSSPEKLRGRDVGHQENQILSDNQDVFANRGARKPFGRGNDLLSLKTIPNHRLQPSQVDIWTLGGMDSTLPFEKSRDNVLADSVAQSTTSILKEIDQNLVPDTRMLPSATHSPTAPLKPLNLLTDDLRITSPSHPRFSFTLPSTNPTPQKHKSSAAARMRDHRSIISSPPPPTLDFVSAPQKSLPSSTNPQPFPAASSILTLNNVSNPACEKPRMSAPRASKRASGLPDDRVAAAKARLQKRREDARLGIGRGK